MVDFSTSIIGCLIYTHLISLVLCLPSQWGIVNSQTEGIVPPRARQSPISLGISLKYKVFTQQIHLRNLKWRWNLTSTVSEIAKALFPWIRWHSVLHTTVVNGLSSLQQIANSSCLHFKFIWHLCFTYWYQLLLWRLVRGSQYPADANDRRFSFLLLVKLDCIDG